MALPRADVPNGTMIATAPRTNVYAGSLLDRVSQRRDDAPWVEARLDDPGSLLVPLWGGRCLVSGAEGDSPRAVLLSGPEAAACRAAGGPWALLGLLDGRAVFACEAMPPDAPEGIATPPEFAGGTVVELRRVAGALPAGEAAMLAHARALLHWRSRHRFCGVCGAGCAPQSAGNVVACSRCGTHHFPRTDPAVIMLVTRGDQVLLGHSQRFPRTTMYSTLAGFVEPGETLEEAVRREVHEESGITVGAVRYHSSQPWPFPSNIMLGFYGEALDEHITIDPTELRDARWFGRTELRDPEAHGFHLPGPDSIARRLIEDWIAGA